MKSEKFLGEEKTKQEEEEEKSKKHDFIYVLVSDYPIGRCSVYTKYVVRK